MDAGNDAQNHKIVIVSGGTAGHILPASVLAYNLFQQGSVVSWLGDHKSLEMLSLKDELAKSYLLHAKSPRNWRRMFSLDYYAQLFRDIRTILTAYHQNRPSAVVVTGGMIGFIPGLIALFKRIPVIICEQNVILGSANYWLAFLGAQRIFYGLPAEVNPFPQKSSYAPQLLRQEILSTQPQHKKMSPLKKVLLIVGGSLGARPFNHQLVLALSQIDALKSWSIVHIAGPQADCLEIKKRYHHPDCQILSYTHQMHELYAQADCVIARSGALTLSELHYLGKATVTIPLPQAAGDHQRANAYAMAQKAPAMCVLEEKDISPVRLEEMIYYSLLMASEAQSKTDPSYHQSPSEVAKECLVLCQQR